jgi:hypothetical protein
MEKGEWMEMLRKYLGDFRKDIKGPIQTIILE